MASLKDQRKEAAELLAYVKQLAIAAASADQAQTRGNLVTVLQQRQAEYQKLTEEIKKTADAEKAAAPSLGHQVGAAVGSAVRGGARVASAATGNVSAAAGLTGLSGPVGGLVDKFTELAGVAGALGSAMAPFTAAVQAFDPGLVMLFQQALEDLQASLGAIFAPLIPIAIQFANVLNQAFTSLAPVLQPVIEQLGGLLKDLGEAFVAAVVPLIQALAPALAALLEQVRPLAAVMGETLAQFGALIGEMVTALMPLVQAVLPLLAQGLRLFHTVVQEVIAGVRATLATLKHIIDTWNEPGAWAPERIQRVFSEALDAARQPASRPVEAGDPRTSAARQARTVGIEDIGRNARLAGFGAGNGPAAATAANTLRIAETLEAFRQALPEHLRESFDRTVNRSRGDAAVDFAGAG